ncbi:MAG: LanC-like protein [Hyphomicrobiaceae bacterium]
MIDAGRHVPLRAIAWDPGTATAAIDEIVADALSAFDPRRFWPAHPQDAGLRDGHTGVYVGPVGVIWALDYLARVGATETRHDLRPVLPHLLAALRERFPKLAYGSHGSLHCGEMGAALVAMRLDPTPAYADLVYRHAEANADQPIRELMWGLPGSMLACLAMHEMTGEARWRALYAAQAARLLDDLADTPAGPLWTQDLYGEHAVFLGPVHGYAGNMASLLRGWDWLTPAQQARIADAVPRTLAGTARRSEAGANWPARANVRALRCQHCHGAPGMVTTFADSPFASPELDALLAEGGSFTWAMGPLAKGSSLCHGTGGNGYAFLKLHRRLKEPLWLDRARAFAMTAIAQCREAHAQTGRGRYSLWTGDVGLACYLWDCLTANPQFPTVDVL